MRGQLPAISILLLRVPQLSAMKGRTTDPVHQARKHEASKFRGVSPCGKTRFRAQIYYDGESECTCSPLLVACLIVALEMKTGHQSYIGCFKSAAEAAAAYDKVARKVHGDRAKVNFSLDESQASQGQEASGDSDGGKATPLTSAESELSTFSQAPDSPDPAAAELALSKLKAGKSPLELKPKLQHNAHSSYHAAIAPFVALQPAAISFTEYWGSRRNSLPALLNHLEHQRRAIAEQWVHASRFGWVHNSFTAELADEYVALSIRCDDIEHRMAAVSLAAPTAAAHPAPSPSLGKRSFAMMY